MIKIELANHGCAVIDEEDYSIVSKLKWRAVFNGFTWYAISTYHKKTVYMHRLIMKEAETCVHIDHINSNGLDNRKENLRSCNGSQNNMNRKKSMIATSIYKGVYWDRSAGRWVARVKINRKPVYERSFTREIDAAIAYDSTAKAIFGEYARTNF